MSIFMLCLNNSLRVWKAFSCIWDFSCFDRRFLFAEFWFWSDWHAASTCHSSATFSLHFLPHPSGRRKWPLTSGVWNTSGSLSTLVTVTLVLWRPSWCSLWFWCIANPKKLLDWKLLLNLNQKSFRPLSQYKRPHVHPWVIHIRHCAFVCQTPCLPHIYSHRHMAAQPRVTCSWRPALHFRHGWVVITALTSTMPIRLGS